MLWRKCACETGLSEDDAPLHRSATGSAGAITSSAISKPTDAAELQADRVATSLMGDAPASHGLRAGRWAPAATIRKVHGVPDLVNQVLTSPGHALDRSARAFFEPKLGMDLGHIRVHTGRAAEEAAALVQARAFTVGHDLVFGAAQYRPATPAGRHLLAHELAHTLQPPQASRAQRQPAPDAGERRDAGSPATVVEPQDAGPDPTKAPGSPETVGATVTPAATPAAPATYSGHTAAPAGMATCPDPPMHRIVVLACTATPAKAPPPKEKAELPTVPTANFGGDPDRITFATELAQCWAQREVKAEIEKRFVSDVATIRKAATEQAATETKGAVAKAAEGIDPKDRAAVNTAVNQATKNAKAAAAKKIADAQRAVTRQDVATVTAELAKTRRASLEADYTATIDAAIHRRYGPSWRTQMQAVLERERRRITKQKTAKPTVKKGETPPPAKPQETIDAEIEAEMTAVRCDRKEWALQQIEDIARGWAVGRREQVDFQTVPQRAAYLKGFDPTYAPAEADKVQVPASVRQGGADAVLTPIAPETATFLLELEKDLSAARPPLSFAASNYGGHGLGSWAGKGFSLDLYLTVPKDVRGFWDSTAAINFLLGVDRTARALGARWRVLYNDFGVAQAVNAATGTRNVEFVGGIDKGGNLNWHGPDPVILHFHLDLEIPQGAKVAPPPAP